MTEKKFKVIQGDRRKLEQEVLQVLINPAATKQDLEKAVKSLKPRGGLKNLKI